MRKRIVIVSPSADVASSLEQVLRDSGCNPETVRQYPTIRELQSLLSGQPPTAGVLIDHAGESQALSLIRRLHRSHPELPLVIVNGPRRLSAVVQTKTAGAWGYIPEPNTNADIRNLAEQLKHERKAEHQETGPGTLVSFIPAQGGNGASTIALHVGAVVSEQDVGRSVLVDFDLHTGTAAFQLGLRSERTLVSTLTSGDITEESLGRAIARNECLDVLVGVPHQ